MTTLLNQRIDAQQLNNMIKMIKVIAHPIRLSIVDILTEKKKMTVLEVQEALDLEQAVASQHLTLMENKGVLIGEKVGKNKFVSLRFPKMKNIITCLENCNC